MTARTTAALAAAALLVPLAGCRLFRPPTPEEAWDDFRRYYHDNCIIVTAPTQPLELVEIPPADQPATAKRYEADGYVTLGWFQTGDGAYADEDTLRALAAYLKADILLWGSTDGAAALRAPRQGAIIGTGLAGPLTDNDADPRRHEKLLAPEVGSSFRITVLHRKPARGK